MSKLTREQATFISYFCHTPESHPDFLQDARKVCKQLVARYKNEDKTITNAVYKMALKTLSKIDRIYNPNVYLELPVDSEDNTKVISLNAFLKSSAKKVDAKVLAFIIKYPESSRGDAANFLNMRINTVTGAVKRLLDLNLIAERGTKHDKSTNRKVKTLICITTF